MWNNRLNYNYGNNYNNNGYQQPRKQQKKSGASHKTYTPSQGPNKGELQHFTFGWRRTRYGFITYSCVTTSKSKETEKGWFGSVAIEIVNKDTGSKSFAWGTMERKTGKVVVDSLSLVINPRAKNGGYCGSYLNN